MARQLTPRQRSYIRKRSKRVELEGAEAAGELNIIPFLDIVINLIMFLLFTTQAVLLISQIETDLPKISRGGPKKTDVTTPLNLNVTVTATGIIVSGSGGKLAPSCEDIEPGGSPTVAMKGDKYDWPGLTDCVEKVKKQFEEEDTVTVSADPQIEYEHIIAAMDHVRNKGDFKLFPKVLISVGVR